MSGDDRTGERYGPAPDEPLFCEACGEPVAAEGGSEHPILCLKCASIDTVTEERLERDHFEDLGDE